MPNYAKYIIITTKRKCGYYRRQTKFSNFTIFFINIVDKNITTANSYFHLEPLQKCQNKNESIKGVQKTKQKHDYKCHIIKLYMC